MSPDNKDSDTSTHHPNPRVRTVGGTEYSWCRPVPGGTGTTVLALLLSNPQTSHFSKMSSTTSKFPILSSVPNSTSTVPHLQIQLFDLPSTAHILQSNSNSSISPFHLILEHEINRNTWINPGGQSDNDDTDVLFASVYTLSEAQWAVMIRLHTSACDRTAAVALLKGLMVEMERGAKMEFVGNGEVNFGIEELIPNGQCKPFWARGVDMLGYSLNSFRFSNLEFKDINSIRSTRVVRLQMNPQDTWKLLASKKKMTSEEICCVVTGERGFAARHLVEMLIRYEIYSVRIANLSATIDLEPTEKNGVLGDALRAGLAVYIPTDLRHKDQVLKACEGAEVVFHMASPNSSNNNYQLHHSVNVDGTKNVIDACVQGKVKQLIYTSSPSVVFDEVHGILDGEESLPYPAKAYFITNMEPIKF